MHPSLPSFQAPLTTTDTAHRLIRLSSWPDLSRTDPDAIHDLAQICALLALQPTPIADISPLLDMPGDRVDSLMSFLQSQGHAAPLDVSIHQHFQETLPPAPLSPDEVAPSPRLLSRLWSRLTSARRH